MDIKKGEKVKDLLKNIVAEIAGEHAVGVVDLLHNKKNVNEFLIAKKLDLTINQTRNILYKLADEGLVSFIRKKDTRKGGWYTYFWTLDVGKSLSKFKEKLSHNLKHLRGQLESRKTKRYFYCSNCDLEFSEENALANEYSCPECGELLELKKSAAEIESIKSEISKFETILSQIEEELEIVGKKADRARERRFREAKKKKEEERLKRKKKRDRLKKKLAKGEKKVKKAKKKVKKKVKKAKKKVKKVVKRVKKKVKKVVKKVKKVVKKVKKKVKKVSKKRRS